MDWDTYMGVLNDQQQQLELFVKAAKTLNGDSRPGTDMGLTMDPSTILARTENNSVHKIAPLAAIALHQFEFNQAVIAMLTDLDNRKRE